MKFVVLKQRAFVVSRLLLNLICNLHSVHSHFTFLYSINILFHCFSGSLFINYLSTELTIDWFVTYLYSSTVLVLVNDISLYLNLICKKRFVIVFYDFFINVFCMFILLIFINLASSFNLWNKYSFIFR